MPDIPLQFDVITTVEFLDGRAVCRTSEELEIAAITNHSYADCLDFLFRKKLRDQIESPVYIVHVVEFTT